MVMNSAQKKLPLKPSRSDLASVKTYDTVIILFKIVDIKKRNIADFTNRTHLKSHIKFYNKQITNERESWFQESVDFFKNNESEEMVVACLLHDIGDGLAPQNHDKFSAEVIRPFVRWEVTWTVAHHGIFQMIYYQGH